MKFDPAKIAKLRILVVGDIMIDSYYFGTVDRISPEAPVPVVNISGRENRLGGAGNVALNILALGATPIVCSVIGNDVNAEILKKLLKKNKIKEDGLVTERGRLTTLKSRVIGNRHQMIRIDEEDTNSIKVQSSEALVKKIIRLLPKTDALVFVDYDKGVLTAENIKAIIEAASSKNIPTIVDPKRRNFMNYAGVSLFKPNLKEMREGLKTYENLKDAKTLDKIARSFLKKMKFEKIMVTLSENGVYISDKNSYEHMPAMVRNISDVSGAGDTVVSVAAVCLALGLPMKEIARISNIAGGLVCEEVGVVPVNLKKLLSEIK